MFDTLGIRARALRACLVGLGITFFACSDSDEEPEKKQESTGPYAIMSLTSAGDEPLSYFARLKAIEPQKVDFDTAREFAGTADMWVYDDALFIMETETLSITKFRVEADGLTEEETINFKEFGLTDFGFWTNFFLSPTKAYVVNEVQEYISWNPKEMTIGDTVPIPELEGPEGLSPFASYADRSIAIRDGLLYHPFYYTDEDYFKFSEHSSIAVYDIDTDALVRVIEAPCPGLDHATQDEEGNLYFSAWIFAPGGAANLDQPPTCVAKIEKDATEATVAFTMKDVTGGREGGLFRYTGDGKALMSVLHKDHAPEEELDDPSAVTYGPHWRFWSYDFESGEAREIESIDWNAGAAYPASADDRAYALVPSGGYTSTQVVDVSNPEAPEEVFEVDGWALRLVELP